MNKILQDKYKKCIQLHFNNFVGGARFSVSLRGCHRDVQIIFTKNAGFRYVTKLLMLL